MFKNFHLIKGNQAEKAALKYLKSFGLKMLQKNYMSRLGEIDIIMLDNTTLVFIEVRYRKNDAFGGAIESITPQKQHRIRKTAEQFLQENADLEFNQSRFDVVAMNGSNKAYKFDWIKNAF